MWQWRWTPENQNKSALEPNITARRQSDLPMLCLIQPRGARTQSCFGVSVAHFAVRQCDGDTTQGATPPHPRRSLDLLSGKLSCVCCDLSCFTSTPLGICCREQNIVFHWTGVSTLHVMPSRHIVSRLHCFHPTIIQSNLSRRQRMHLQTQRPQGLTDLLC